MSKVLIDRAVLEATLEHAEFVSGAACDADDAIRAVLSAPSGTPAMPVKAYYYEAPNEYGGLNKSVGLEVRKAFADAPLVLEADALARIACLEGEIAKRDARIVELESDLAGTQSRVLSLQDQWRKLDAELAAIKAQGPLTVEFMQFMTAVVTGAGLLSHGKQSKGLASELSATAYKYMLGAQVSGYQQKPIGYRCWFNKEPKNIMFEWGESLPSDMNPSATYQELYAAPVSEAKEQGVVQWPEADEIMQMAFEEGHPADDASGYYFELEEFDLFIERLMSEVARLNAAPVQQVSVPAWMTSASTFVDRLYMAGWRDHADAQHAGVAGMYDELIAAAPAAPAADAGLVLEQAMYALIGIGYHENSGLVHELRQSLAAHRAKGVV